MCYALGACRRPAAADRFRDGVFVSGHAAARSDRALATQTGTGVGV
jgi:hypothetical protein